MRSKLLIVNTGCANIASVKYAVQRLGVAVTVSDDPREIASADRVLLPGVGSAQSAMASITKKQLLEVLTRLEQPVLGICLGMQLLASTSQEMAGSHLASNRTKQLFCLDLVPTDIKRMDAGDLVLPHMGWNQITPNSDSPLFKQIDDGTYFYFVHSFCAPISIYTLAQCEYGQAFSAAIGKDNYQGVQFHPERSGDAGAQLLKNFMEI